MKLFCSAFLMLFMSISCSRSKEAKPVIYIPVAEAKCNTDPANTYHFIRPQHRMENLPLLIILDSGGDGLMAVQKIEGAVSRIPCVAVGSDLVRNNYPGYEQAIETLINDAVQKFHTNKELVYLAGFSGGARMAFDYAMQHQVKGVLMCGAGPNVNSLQDLPCPVYMIAGTTDFNFSETYYNPLTKTDQQRILADYFRGKHEWPPAGILQDGLLFLMGRSIQNGKSLLKHESALLSEKADSLMNKEKSLLTVKAVEKALAFNPKNKMAEKQMDRIKHDPEYTASLEKIESDLMLESKIDQAYAQASMQQDSIWWTNELKQLSLAIKGHTGDEKDHFLRIKAFLGILYFSQLNNLIRSDQTNKQIVQLLAVYRQAEPENPDVYYDYALYNWKLGNKKMTRKELKMALSLGFKDRLKLENDFPADMINEVLPSTH